eukprot:scaffold16355_cov170-Amphora_coffeaeformis.AAC.1
MDDCNNLQPTVSKVVEGQGSKVIHLPAHVTCVGESALAKPESRATTGRAELNAQPQKEEYRILYIGWYKNVTTGTFVLKFELRQILLTIESCCGTAT